MTKHQKQRLKKKNAEKDSLRRKITEEDVIKTMSDIRKQEAEINARLDEREKEIEDKWQDWCEWFCHYSIPRICVGFFYSALQTGKIFLTKGAMESFMDKLSVEMQSVIDMVGEGESDLDRFDYYAELLEKEGYAVPVWAQKGDLEKKWEEEKREK